MTLLAGQVDLSPQDIPVPAGPPEPEQAENNGAVIRVTDLVRKFGSFIAVNHVSFSVRKGQVFGLLGPNGAGKSTTFRMLCGLLPASGGTLKVAGADLRTAAARARRKVGYVAQKFSMYGMLTTRQNLGFFAGAYGMSGKERQEAIRSMEEEFRLTPYMNAPRRAPARRLQAAPQHGVRPAPLPRTSFFWMNPLPARIPWPGGTSGCASTPWRKKGVTVIITTHFLGEAEFCDNMLIMMDGTTLAEGSPDDIRKHAPPARRRSPSLAGRRLPGHHGRTHEERRSRNMTASLKRIGALIVKELHQVVRDPGNIGIAVILPAVLLLLFGYGMSMDIKNVRIAYLAVPASSQSTDLETRLTLSRYFQTSRVFSTREAEEKLRTHEADAFIALQSDAPDTLHHGITKVQIVVNGVNANQATLIRNYLQAVVASWAASPERSGRPRAERADARPLQ